MRWRCAQDERQAFADVAAEAGVPFTGLWLAAPEETMAARLGARQGDASDASAEVLRLQLGHDPGPATGCRSTPAAIPTRPWPPRTAPVLQ